MKKAKTKGVLEKKTVENKKDMTNTIIMLLVGLVLFFMPDTLNSILGIVIGLILLVLGLVTIFQYLQNKVGTTFNLASGIFYSVLGVFIMLYPNSVIRFIAICLGVYLIINGLVKLCLSIKLKNTNLNWIGTFVISLLIMVLGALLIFNPFSGIAITRLAGIYLIIVSVFEIVDVYILQKR